MTTETSTATDQAHIRALIVQQVRAVHAKDTDGLMTNYAPDLLSFNVADPLRSVE